MVSFKQSHVAFSSESLLPGGPNLLHALCTSSTYHADEFSIASRDILHVLSPACCTQASATSIAACHTTLMQTVTLAANMRHAPATGVPARWRSAPSQQARASPPVAPQSRRRPTAAPVRAAGAAAADIEAVEGVRPEIDAAVQQALGQCLTDSDLGMGKKYKVRGYAAAPRRIVPPAVAAISLVGLP